MAFPQQNPTTAVKKRPVIYIQDFENRGKSYGVFGDVMKYSLKGILGLTKNYRIVTSDDLDAYLQEVGAQDLKDKLVNKEAFLKYRSDLLFTEVLRGSFISIQNGARVLWEIQVFKLADGEDSFAQAYQSTADAEIFDVIDGIGQDMAGVLTGKVLETARVDVSTMVPGSVIYIDGIAAGKNKVQYKKAIAGLAHKVEIRDADNEVLFEKTIVPVKGLIYDVNYNFREYEKLVEKKVILPATNTIFSTNRVAMTNRVITTNQMKVEIFSTNWVEEKVTKQVEVEKVKYIDYHKWGWGINGGGGVMAGVSGYYQFQGLKFELNLGLVPQFLGYTTDTYLSAALSVSLFPLGANVAVSPYIRLGVMTYYGLELGIIPTYLNELMAVGLSFRFKGLPGFLGRMRIHAEWGGMGPPIINSPVNTIPYDIFNKSTLGFGISF